jgi:hypothetical protein
MNHAIAQADGLARAGPRAPGPALPLVSDLVPANRPLTVDDEP